jgi:hypothetical protein
MREKMIKGIAISLSDRIKISPKGLIQFCVKSKSPKPWALRPHISPRAIPINILPYSGSFLTLQKYESFAGKKVLGKEVEPV